MKSRAKRIRMRREVRDRTDRFGHVLCDHPLMREPATILWPLCPRAATHVMRELDFKYDVPLCTSHAAAMKRTAPRMKSLERIRGHQ